MEWIFISRFIWACYIILQRNSEQFHCLSTVCSVAIPVFHAYAHNVHCQYMYSPRHRLGFGLTDGENLERLWSYLGMFCKMTKEMNPAHRIDTLTDALCHYSYQKCAKMGRTILVLHAWFEPTFTLKHTFTREQYCPADEECTKYKIILRARAEENLCSSFY